MKILSVGQAARDKLKQGIDLVADSVKFTLGPSGRNVVLGRIDLPPTITNDGVSIARNIEHEDETINEGVWIMKEALSLTSNKSKDATTTTAILTQSITNKLFEIVKGDGTILSEKVDVIDLKRKVDEACEEIVQKLQKKARPITLKEIYNVAIVAGEYKWLAELVENVYKEIGKDGHVTIEEGIRTEYEVFKGIELNAGYSSDYFINNDDRECVMENPAILVTNNQLDTPYIVPLMAELISNEIKSIVLVAPEFTPNLLKELNTLKLKKDISIVAVKLPTFGKEDLLIDVATLTKAKFLDKNTYTKLEDFVKDITLSNFGIADKAVISDKKTVFIGGKGDTKDRVKQIRKLLKETTSMFDKDILEKRIAFLSGGIAIIRIGAESDFEKVYFKLKADNTVSSVENALNDGVVKGGGVTLKEIAESLPKNILSESIKSPYLQLQENNGSPFEVPDTIIDPVKNTISALKTACSIAGTVVTTERVISFKNKYNEQKDN